MPVKDDLVPPATMGDYQAALEEVAFLLETEADWLLRKCQNATQDRKDIIAAISKYLDRMATCVRTPHGIRAAIKSAREKS